MSQSETGVLILAAGRSSRLGSPKQLLEYKGRTLLEHSMLCARSVSKNVLVVLGGNSKEILKEMEFVKVHTAINPTWADGIGNSISFGVRTFENIIPELKSLMIILSDQPRISSSLLTDLSSNHSKRNKLITACNYGDATGVPAIFDQSLFGELKKLKNDKGAKSIIQANFDQTAFIDFPEGKMDIDTESDLQYLD